MPQEGKAGWVDPPVALTLTYPEGLGFCRQFDPLETKQHILTFSQLLVVFQHVNTA